VETNQWPTTSAGCEWNSRTTAVATLRPGSRWRTTRRGRTAPAGVQPACPPGVVLREGCVGASGTVVRIVRWFSSADDLGRDIAEVVEQFAVAGVEQLDRDVVGAGFDQLRHAIGS
jgi:hypothetical protein